MAYVNDRLFISNKEIVLTTDMEQFLSVLGWVEQELNGDLEVHVVKSNKVLELSQTTSIDFKFSSFGLNDCKFFQNQMGNNIYKDSTVHKNEERILKKTYCHMIGSL